ncbi:uncharacterized protein LOC141695753 [Apium graveolens]|uniref:uncharacterized protein LOC141695753 n=1 Tax=Apium graveolens TaxID=4045 RepID=UPI003D795B0E
MSAIDKSRAKELFGGITIVFGGDFRHILPVIPKASKAEVFFSTLNKSKLWESCEVFLLKQNMRLNAGNSDLENKTIADCKIPKNSIECEILCGSHVGTKHLIPRIEVIPSDTNWPFEFKRVQFLIQICYAMTINKSQGQSPNTFGLYLPKDAFSHGHIYVSISRVTRPEGLHILIDSDDGISTDITNNVVFEEVFYNLPSVDN